MKKVRLDNGIEYDAAPEVEQELNRLRADAKTAGDARDTEKARADAAESKITEKDKEIEALKQDAVQEARARVELEATAKEHGVEIKQDSTDRAVKEAVITKLRADAKLEGQSDAYVDATFDIVTKDAAQRRNDGAEQRRTVTGNPNERHDGAESRQDSMSARDRMIARMKGEKVEGDA